MPLDEKSAETTTTAMTQTKGVVKKTAARATKARSLACRECRDRKIRCDGARPLCDSCSRRGLGADQCRYPEIEHEGSIASSRSYIRALQKRVQELEAREQQAQSLSPQGQHACVGAGPSHEDGWNKPKVLEQPLLPSIHADGTYGVQRYPSAGPLSSGHDSMHYYPHPRGQMGASPPLTDDLEDHSPAKVSFGSYSTNSRAALMLSKISLPPAELMEDLIREYFDSDWISMPLVHRPTFFTKYDRLIAVSNSRYRRDIPLEEATELAATYCLLMGMLALGERAKCGRADAFGSDAGGIEFHEQARGLLLTDLISTPSIVVVQAMLLHARFLRRNGSSQESWVLAGLAHRLAEGLLLHVDLPGKTQAEREERRRVWCACAYTTRMQGVAYGKSSASVPEFGPFPQEVDDEYLESQTRGLDRTQPPEAPSAISFFVHNLRLSDNILQPIQSSFFDKQESDKKETATEILGTTLKLDAELQGWWDSLPRHLQLAGQSHTVFGRQVALMRIRYLESKALLYRATIMKLVRTYAGAPITGLTKVLLSGVVDACFSTSVDFMESINYHKDVLTVTGVPECQTVISLCNIGMTLRVLLKHPLLSDPIKTNAYEKEIHDCLFFVRRFNTSRLALADKYIHVFEALARPQSHSPARNIDPILDTIMSRETQQTEKFASATKAEMAMLDAWYQVEPDLTGLDFSIREIVSFW